MYIEDVSLEQAKQEVVKVLTDLLIVDGKINVDNLTAAEAQTAIMGLEFYLAIKRAEEFAASPKAA